MAHPPPHAERSSGTEEGTTVELSNASLSRISTQVHLPSYDRRALRPSIVHIGVGGFHRGHFASYIDELASMGHTAWGIVGAGILEGDSAMATALTAQDHLYTLVTRSEESADARVVGSLVGFVHSYPALDPLIELIASPTTQIVSLTITEGGYPVDDETGAFDPRSPKGEADSAFAALVRGLRRRHDAGHGPLTVLSFDNIMGNGHVSKVATTGVAERIDAGLVDWIDEQISFPSSMVDRIVPMTTDRDREWVSRELGYTDRWPVMTEPFRQWVVEDRFVSQRLPLEELDVIVTDDVEPYELFKLRLLNASHSCLAYLARLVGHELVDGAMAEPRFTAFVRRFLEREAGPSVPRAPGIHLAEYQATLISRFSNPAIGDQIDRLCLDGSSKFPKFLLPTVRAQLGSGGPVELAALALAGWCVYLAGTSETGDELPLAHDPRLEEARRYALDARREPAGFLRFRAVFGDDLPADERFTAAFTDAVGRVRSVGVRAAIDHALVEEE
jgi:mannitol 2-dehydrogenase